MIGWIHPGLIFILGALMIPVLRGTAKKVYLLALPIAALADIVWFSGGIPFTTWQIQFENFVLTLGRVDQLSLVFAYIFTIAALCMTLYALHIREAGHHIAAFLYVGSTLGVVFAGDLFSLYLFSEIMAWASLFLIWYRRTRQSSEAGLRYIMVHIFGGVCLLAGIILHVQGTGSIAFDALDWGFGWAYLAPYLMLLGILVNAAAFPLHAWLADAYPEATAAGTVFLSAFTTKSAIYILLRGFPGVELLVWLGAITAVYGVIFALMANDMRRVLAYALISQGGYMLAGVGMASMTLLAADGAIAHAVCCILYMGLMFMATGAVLEMTGSSKLNELGGLYKRTPATFWLYMVGAFSIAGMPLFSGFVSKTMIIESATALPVVWLLLEVASAGAFIVAALKLPYLVWFSKTEPGVEVREPPANMLVAMALTAFLCVFIGVYPHALYSVLPYPVEYVPYTAGHVVEMGQYLIFAFLGFWLLKGTIHPAPAITIDTDWFYRVGGRKFIRFCERPLIDFADAIDRVMKDIADSLVWFSKNPALASRILLLSVGVVVTKQLNPTYVQYERDLEELRRLYPTEPEHHVAIGMGVLLVLLFFTMYLLIYLTYGVLWT